MKQVEVSGKSVEEALEKALKELNLTKDRVNFKVLEEGSKGFLNFIGTKPARILVDIKPTSLELGIDFLKSVLNEMGISTELIVEETDDIVKINITGKDVKYAIGYRGETLNSLQYLTSIVVNKDEKTSYKRVILNAENYREKREKTLENLALKTAYKVKKYGRSYKLEPMQSYERRIIHATLQNDLEVTTTSEGVEPFRRVLISLKK
ncbi:RNA-binding cell elongation regulator Jag/EloR [Clostridium massiliamazoniense]|uniref:RNA-binding cell elongation regulator Jag/EloR n=1 Tax=Clostridium massiliamazoniense TaxID=1347366 RepID=UPI0006D83E48|nr:RNA-binding cell elongation regulator Jag/EloR [Clostridium massiliamazoniense]